MTQTTPRQKWKQREWIRRMARLRCRLAKIIGPQDIYIPSIDEALQEVRKL